MAQTLGGWVGLKDQLWDTREIVTSRAEDVDGRAKTLLVNVVGGASVVPQHDSHLLGYLGSSHGEAAGVGAEQEVDLRSSSYEMRRTRSRPSAALLRSS